MLHNNIMEKQKPTKDKIKHEEDDKGKFYQFGEGPKRYYHSKIGRKLAHKKVIADRDEYYWREELKNQSNVLVFD